LLVLKGISIVIPAFNEVSTIRNVVKDVIFVVSRISGISFYEVIVVDDGSTDGTLKVVKDLNVVVLKNEVNKGKGYALRRGFRRARGEVIVTLDADGSHFPEDLPLVIAPLLKGEVDMVIGSRFGHKQAFFTRALNIAGNSLFNIFFYILTGRRFSDSQSGFRAFKRDILGVLNLSAKSYDIESEMLMEALMKNLCIKEVSIRCIPRLCGGLGIRSFRDGYKILKRIFLSYFKAVCDKKKADYER